jgi:hypothetical protein
MECGNKMASSERIFLEPLDPSVRHTKEATDLYNKLTKIFHNTEERFNKLEEENKRLRKIIDDLQPARSKYM